MSQHGVENGSCIFPLFHQGVENASGLRKLAQSVPIQESGAKMGVQADTIDEDDEDVPGKLSHRKGQCIVNPYTKKITENISTGGTGLKVLCTKFQKFDFTRTFPLCVHFIFD